MLPIMWDALRLKSVEINNTPTTATSTTTTNATSIEHLYVKTLSALKLLVTKLTGYLFNPPTTWQVMQGIINFL